MGATPWQEMGPNDDDPNESLRAAQREHLRFINLSRLVEEHLRSSRDAVRAVEAEGDRFGLLHIYRGQAEMLERISAEGIPTDPDQQIALLRRIHAGEGVGNSLDVEGVSDEPVVFRARRLTDAELRDLFATTTPDEELAATAMQKLAPTLGRAESVCFRVFDHERRPIGWWFTGNSLD